MRRIVHDLLIGVSSSIITIAAIALFQNSSTVARAEKTDNLEIAAPNPKGEASSVSFETKYVSSLQRYVTVAIYDGDLEIVQ